MRYSIPRTGSTPQPFLISWAIAVDGASITGVSPGCLCPRVDVVVHPGVKGETNRTMERETVHLRQKPDCSATEDVLEVS